MSGFVRFESDWWEDVLEALPRPLTRARAAMDLRVLADRHRVYDGGPLPSHKELAERWGWFTCTGKPAEKRVRLLKRDEEAWKDPYRAGSTPPTTPKGQAKGRQRAGKGQAKGRPGAEEAGESGERGQAKGRQRAGKGQAKGHTRGGSPNTDTDTDPPNPPERGADEGQVEWLLSRFAGDVLTLTTAQAVTALTTAKSPRCSRRARHVAASLEEARRRWPARKRHAEEQQRRTLLDRDAFVASLGDTGGLLDDRDLDRCWRAALEEAGLDPPPLPSSTTPTTTHPGTAA